jgi:hypothetical protein
VTGLTQTAEEFRSKLRSEWPWVRLFAIRRPDGYWYRLARFDQTIEFGTSTTGAVIEWSPYDINFRPIERDMRGDLPELTLVISNASRQVLDDLNEHDFGGQPVRIMVVHLQELDNPDAKVVDEVGRIARVSAKEEGVAVTISGVNMYAIKFPSRRYDRLHCGNVYGDDLCRIDMSLSGMPQTCGLTRADCEARGVIELAETGVQNHPKWFGAYPGITRPSSRRGAGW